MIIAKIKKNRRTNTFKADLNEIRNDMKGANAYIEKFTLSFSPKDKSMFGGMRFLGSKMVNMKEVFDPSFLVEGAKTVSKWGGPFLDSKAPNFEWPWVNEHISFKKNAETLILPKGDMKQNEIYKSKTSRSGMAHLQLSKLNRDILGRDIAIKTNLDLDKISVDEKGLSLAGKGEGVIEIAWKISKVIKKDSRFFLNVTKDELRVENMLVIPTLAGRELQAIEGNVNRPLKIEKNKIDELKILLRIKKGRFRILLDEMILFRPTLLSSGSILKAPFPVKNNIKLVPRNIKLTGGKFEAFGNSLDAMFDLKTSSQKSLTWETKIQRKFHEINGIEIHHWILPEMVGGDPCWLKMNWVGSSNQVSQRICLGFKGGGFVSVKNFPRGLKLDEKIQSINWEASLKPETGKGFGMFHFDADIEVSDAEKVWEMLIRGLDVSQKLEKKALFESENAFADIMSGDLLLKLDPRIVDRFPDETPYKLENDRLYAKKIFFEKNKNLLKADTYSLPILEGEQAGFATQEEYEMFVYAFIFVLLGTIIWWLYGKYSSKVSSAIIKEHIHSIFKSLKRVLFIVFEYLNKSSNVFNRIFCFIAIVPGMWLAGNYGLESAWSNELLVSLLVLLLVGLWHELNRVFQGANENENFWCVFLFGRGEKIPWSIIVLTVLVIGWVAFQQGTDLNQGQVQVFFPLLSLFYFYIPWFFFKSKVNRLLFDKEFFVLIFAIAMYEIGILTHSIYGKGSNFFFTFGVLVSLVVWRGFIKKISRPFEHRLPNLWNEIKDRASSQFIVGALLFFGFTAVFRLIQLNELAEPFGSIGFAMLALGVFLELKEQKDSRNSNLPSKSNFIQASNNRPPIA